MFIISSKKQDQIFGVLEKSYQHNRSRKAQDLLIVEQLNSLKLYWKIVENYQIQEILQDITMNEDEKQQEEEKHDDNDDTQVEFTIIPDQ